MCTGIELLTALAGSALSAGGAMITQREQQRNAERMAEARNNELKRTLLKNDDLAKQSRDTFNQRSDQMKADEVAKQQVEATDQRSTALETAAVETPTQVEDVPLAGSAPTVVKSELAKRMGDAIAGSKQQAKAQAKLGGFGDMWMNQGFKDVEAGRDIAQHANFASGNLSILPYQQDIAEMRASRPISPLGGLLSGFGGMLSSYGGSGGMVPKKRYTGRNSYFPGQGLW